jgi:hypothetical protein
MADINSKIINKINIFFLMADINIIYYNIYYDKQIINKSY